MRVTDSHRLLVLAASAALSAAVAVCGCGDRPSPPHRSLPESASPPTPSHAAGSIPPGEGRSDKPEQPLDLEFWFDTPPAPGASVRLGVAVTPRADLPDCSVEVQLPQGIEVVTGDRVWQGPLARARRSDRFLTVRVPDGRRYELVASAVARYPGGTRAARTARLVIDGPLSPKPAAPAGAIKTNSRGEKILELPADSSR
jgi:hypothetical protein